MFVPAVLDTGMICLLHLLQHLQCNIPVFLEEIDFKISGLVTVGAHMIAPTARGAGFPTLLPALGTCALPFSAVMVHLRR